MHLSWLLTFLQIILESLPISSSTHIALLSSKFGLPFEAALDHAVHGITLIIILLFWRKNFLKMACDSWQKRIHLLTYVLIASIPPTLVFFSSIKYSLSLIPAYYGLIITAVALFCSNSAVIKEKEFSVLQALQLGIAQSLALIPGISRMGITYSFARYMKHSPEQSLWLSCLIEVPICAGGILLALKKIRHIIPLMNDPIPLAVGIIVSACTSYGALYITYKILTQKKPWIFSLYLLVLAFLAL